MLYDISIINYLFQWLVHFKYDFCIPRRMLGIYVNKDGDIGRQMKYNLRHMNKEIDTPNCQIGEQQTLEWV